MTAIDNRIPTATFTLAIGGMACAACAARVTKRLNKLDGVEANVNYATEQATAVTSSGVSVDALIAAIESLGYTATNVDDGHATFADDPPEAVDDTRIRNLRDRLIGTTVLTVPVLALSMIKPLQFEYWQWLTFALAWPVVLWGALPFHRTAWTNLRHGAATMDTLISLGTLTALAWSIYALFRNGAGVPGMKMGFSFTIERTGQDEIHLEVASAVTMFIQAGRYFKANAKRRSGAARPRPRTRPADGRQRTGSPPRCPSGWHRDGAGRRPAERQGRRDPHAAIAGQGRRHGG